MAMKPTTSASKKRPTPPPPPQEKAPVLDDILPALGDVASDGSLRGFLAGFLNAVGVTGEGVEIPYDALPLPVAKAIKEIAEIKCVSGGLVFGQFFSLLSVAGRARCVRRRNDWREHGNLYIIVIADSGGGKTHSMTYIFKDVARLDSYLKTQYRAARKQYAQDLAEWKKQKKADRGPMPEPPPKKRFVVKDSTMAGLVETFESNPRGLLWQANEFAGFFQGIDGHAKNGASEGKRKILDAYDSQDLSAERRSKDGESQDYHVPAAALSLYGHVQTDLLSEVFTERDLYAGLVQRFLFVKAERGEVPYAHDNEISDTTDELIYKISSYFTSLDLEVQNFQISDQITEIIPAPVDVELDQKAREIFNKFYDTLLKTTYGRAIEESFAQKMAGQTLRLSLLLHLLYCATIPAPYRRMIDDIAMEGAIKIIVWCAWNLRQVWEMIPGGKGQPGKEAQVFQVLDFIKGHENFSREWHTTAEMIDAGLKWHGPDLLTQSKNLGGFLTSILKTNADKISEDDAKGKKDGRKKYRLAAFEAVLKEMDDKAR